MDSPRSQSESAGSDGEQTGAQQGKANGAYLTSETDAGENYQPRRVQCVSSTSTHTILPTLVVELYDLHETEVGKDLPGEEWVQLGRWIKYEETVEGPDGHFGLPRIPVLSYHSLTLLNTYLAKAVFLPNVDAETFGDVALSIAEAFSAKFGMKPGASRTFMDTFCKDFKRIPGDKSHMRKCSLSETSVAIRKPSAFLLETIPESINGSEKSTDVIQEETLKPPRKKAAIPKRNSDRKTPSDTEILAERRRSLSVGGVLHVPHQHDLRKISKRHHFAAKLSVVTRPTTKSTIDYIQEGAEACQVFTGIIPDLKDVMLAITRLSEAITVPECVDSLPIRFVSTVVGPAISDAQYSEVGRAIATLMANSEFQEIAYAAMDKADLLRGLNTFMDSSVVIPPGDIYKNDLVHVEDVRKTLRNRKLQRVGVRRSRREPAHPLHPILKHTDGLEDGRQEITVEEAKPTGTAARKPWERTGRPFGGLINDVKRRAPFYLSDFKDALTLQCVSATVFMFFVAFAPAISFGQVMDERFEGYMGITEVFVAQGVVGIIWALCAGQPLLIQAATGPFLVFETALFEFCKSNHLEFLPVRFWVGMWAFIISIVIVLGEGAFLIGYVTRFTEDIFTCLVAGILIFSAFEFVVDVFKTNPLLSPIEYCTSLGPCNATNSSVSSGNFTICGTTDDDTETRDQPNTAMASLVFVIGTFFLAFILKKIRTSRFFGRTIRKALGDFGLPLTILIMVLIAKFAFSDTYLQFVDMPPTFGLTQPSKRGWFIPPMGIKDTLPTWIIGAAIIPAFLICILFFAETDIVQLLLTSKERGLKKPMGFHYDILLCGAMIFVVSLFGLPWMCCAAVPSLAHASAVTVMKKTVPGEKPAVDHVIEQRVTTMLVAILIGACAFLGQVLRNIPISVLMGVFIYLGVSCLLNVQFIHRLVLLFIPRKYFPDLPFCKEVSMWRMHTYTVLQLVAFAILWTVHAIKQSALVFPFVIALEAVSRKFLLPRIFSLEELNALDASDAHGEKELDEDDDIYDESPLPI